jgi:hypothetical protein
VFTQSKVVMFTDSPLDTFPPSPSRSALLDAKADPCHQNGELDTPLYMAVLSNSLQCVTIIAEKVRILGDLSHATCCAIHKNGFAGKF